MIVDVRPAFAFDQRGKVPGSINIPLDRIAINIGRLREMNRPIVVCCEYGQDCMRAASMLRENGITRVLNGGRWESVLRRL